MANPVCAIHTFFFDGWKIQLAIIKELVIPDNSDLLYVMQSEKDYQAVS